MNILYTNNKDRFLSYNIYNTTKKEKPYIIFHHGLMSDMNGSKALWVEEYCKKHDYNFIRFDNFGHGKSSGEFKNQTITDWLEGLNLIINKVQNEKIILVGSSMGAWIAMLAAMKRDIKAIVCISSAPDFTEELMWNKLTQQQKQLMEENNSYDFGDPDAECGHIYPININLIKDGRKHLLLGGEEIDIKCPVHLIHGSCDTDVPASISERVFKKINHGNVVLKLIKDGHHNLSREKDLAIIGNSITEILCRVDVRL